ncbi:MAG: dihydroorotase, partial [Marinobacter alexandrii]
ELGLPELIRALTSGPASVLGRSARLAEGEVADLCVFDPQHYWTPADDTLVSVGRHAPVTGREVPGVVRLTLARGKVAWQHPAS